MAASNQRAGGEFAVAWDVAGAAGLLAAVLVLSAGALWTWGELERLRSEALIATLIADVEAQRVSIHETLPSARRERLDDQPPAAAVVVRAAPAQNTERTLAVSMSPADWRRDQRWRREASPYERSTRQARLDWVYDEEEFVPGDLAPAAPRRKRADELVEGPDGQQIPRWAALQGSAPLQQLAEYDLLYDLWRESTPVGLTESMASSLTFELDTIRPVNYTLDNPHLKAVIEARQELAGLPYIWGEKSQCTPREAETFHRDSNTMGLTISPLQGEKRAEALREVMAHARFNRPEALKTLNQKLPAEDSDSRLLWCDLLERMSDPQAAQTLARISVFDPTPAVRLQARAALANKPVRDYRHVLLAALRFPWPPAAQHAAETLVAVDDQNAVGSLTELIDQPDPRLAYQNEDGAWVRRHVVRIDHSRNCLLCHAAADSSHKLLRASIRQTAAYYADRTGPFVRADITYLRQEFSMPHAVRGTDTSQRFDYFVQTRPATLEEIQKAQTARITLPEKPIPAALAVNPGQPLVLDSPRRAPVVENPYRQAVVYALTRLTALHAGQTAAAWREVYWDEWAGPEHTDLDNGQLAPQRRRQASGR